MYKPPLLINVFIHLSRGEVYTFIKRGGLYIYQGGRFIHLSRGEIYTFIKRRGLYICQERRFIQTSPLDKCINLLS
jgi:hypothetical protein